jgi:hypothetical protein
MRPKSRLFTRQVRASLKTFLRGVDFAPSSEITSFIRKDDSLKGLSEKQREKVALAVLRMPVFQSFTTANCVGDRPQTLWRVNESYEEFRPFKKD